MLVHVYNRILNLRHDFIGSIESSWAGPNDCHSKWSPILFLMLRNVVSSLYGISARSRTIRVDPRSCNWLHGSQSPKQKNKIVWFFCILLHRIEVVAMRKKKTYRSKKSKARDRGDRDRCTIAYLAIYLLYSWIFIYSAIKRCVVNQEEIMSTKLGFDKDFTQFASHSRLTRFQNPKLRALIRNRCVVMSTISRIPFVYFAWPCSALSLPCSHHIPQIPIPTYYLDSNIHSFSQWESNHLFSTMKSELQNHSIPKLFRARVCSPSLKDRNMRGLWSPSTSIPSTSN